MQEIEINFEYSETKVIMNFPETTKIEDALIQFLRKTNSIVSLSPEKISFLFNSKIINLPNYLNKTLSQIFRPRTKNIKVKVISYRNILGGGGPVDFCDVSKKQHEIHELTADGPSYRTTEKGINIYGICKGNKCKANEKEVIVPIKKKSFDLVNEKYDLKCPECSNIIVPKTVGFRQCKYRIFGKKYNNNKIEDFNNIGEAGKSGQIIYYNPNDNGTALMIELKFEVLEYL